MSKPAQRQRVIDKLLSDGEVTNLWAIERHMLRLGAIIKVLRDEGWEIDGDYVQNTKNFQYKLVGRPKRMQSFFEQVRQPDGTVTVRETRRLV